MNVEIGTEIAHFLFWEYINGIFVAVLTPKEMEMDLGEWLWMNLAWENVRVRVSCDAVVDVPDEVRVHGRPAPRLQVRQPLVTGRAEGVHHGVPGLWGAQHDRGAGQGNHRPHEHAQVQGAYTLITKKIKFSSYIRNFRMHGAVAKLQSSSCMEKYLRFSSYIRKHFLIYDFATAPLWNSLYMRKIWFSFLAVSYGKHRITYGQQCQALQVLSIINGACCQK